MRRTTLQSELKLNKKKMFNKENIPQPAKTGRKHFEDSQCQQPQRQNEENPQIKKTIMLFPEKKNITNYDNVIERKPSIRIFQQQTTNQNFRLCDKQSQITTSSTKFQPLRSNSANIYSIFNNDRVKNQKKF
ncbi:unnamed protein product (macronuclear) [Paramecium tetraurelia]|uniref:Uncharacterized protein n=1 Tax=Paramecium tetraurelia TaxID=5888 RepID=A0D6C3_PARTE|nr:uncharacterized protein GSPATT00001631001 [Paramecium tetraurelia]CAK78590.1 unnamed protein product [Paramecium tetraurelia]|eukprot:XP_001445987.1 hypothetical protein (macronuclear) [Paramecium tetraurelia strain d4-2]